MPLIGAAVFDQPRDATLASVAAVTDRHGKVLEKLFCEYAGFGPSRAVAQQVSPSGRGVDVGGLRAGAGVQWRAQVCCWYR